MHGQNVLDNDISEYQNVSAISELFTIKVWGDTLQLSPVTAFPAINRSVVQTTTAPLLPLEGRLLWKRSSKSWTKQSRGRDQLFSTQKLTALVGNLPSFKTFIFHINPFLSSVLRRVYVQKQTSPIVYNTPKCTPYTALIYTLRLHRSTAIFLTYETLDRGKKAPDSREKTQAE